MFPTSEKPRGRLPCEALCHWIRVPRPAPRAALGFALASRSSSCWLMRLSAPQGMWDCLQRLAGRVVCRWELEASGGRVGRGEAVAWSLQAPSVTIGLWPVVQARGQGRARGCQEGVSACPA